MPIHLQTVKIEGVDCLQVSQVEIHHVVNDYAHAILRLIVDEDTAKTFLQQADTDQIKISANDGEKDIVLFVGYIVNLSLEESLGQHKMTLVLRDSSYLLDLKRVHRSFQKLDAKYEEILKPEVEDAKGKIQLKVTDKAIEKIILQLNETPWQFIRRMASQFSASVFTDLTSPAPLVTIGLPDAKDPVEFDSGKVSFTFDDAQFDFLTDNPDLLAEGVKFVAEDFYAVNIVGNFPYLALGDAVKWNKKDYRVKKLSARFVDNILQTNYTLVGKTAFFVTIAKQKNIRGRIFRAQVKKVEKDKIQAHLIDVDEKYDDASTTWFPFATPYSSADGSGWYVMPEVDDYARIIFPSEDTSDAFASSSINSAPLKEPHNKSLKAPGGRELLLTDDGVEIIAEHQKTFIKLDKSKGISVVSAKDITIHADGNISFDANGKIQMVAQKEIAVQSGQSHVKILSNQIDMGGNNIIVGE